MLEQLYYLFLGILKSKKQLISLYMEEFIISDTLKFLVVAIIDFLDDRTDEEYYKNINQTILGGNVMNMSLITMEGKYGAIDTNNSSCHGYYIIKFSLSPYTLQADFIIDGQVISYGKNYVKELIYFQSISILVVLFYKKTNPLTKLFL